MRIGVNALYLIPGEVGGTEIYLRHLMRAMSEIDSEDAFFVFTNRETGRDLLPESRRFHWVPQEVAARFRPARLVWEQTLLPAGCMDLRLDVLLNPGFTAPIAAPCPQVTVFHDMQHKRQPENFRWFDLPFWRFFLWAAAHRSEQLIADSDSGRDDLLKFYRINPEKVTVAPLGVDPEFFQIAKRRDPKPYLLAVSTLHPHKNLDRLLVAFAQFRKEAPQFRLVITGLKGFHTEHLEELRAGLGLRDWAEFTGWIAREELYGLFAGAHAFVYPTRFEGFGLPVLEAMAAGIPLACSNIEPVATVAGDAALQFDPENPDEMVEALRRIVGDEELRRRLSRAGPERAKEFSWARTARLTLACLSRAAE
ncbi:MAG: glycosyltransferase family 4 protein [Bryobacteraceae bacterium]